MARGDKQKETNQFIRGLVTMLLGAIFGTIAYLASSPEISFVFGVMCVYCVIMCFVAILGMGKVHQKNADELDEID
jgi:uncharacterized membrane protein AbrB (regulator of aidB expression)